MFVDNLAPFTVKRVEIEKKTENLGNFVKGNIFTCVSIFRHLRNQTSICIKVRAFADGDLSCDSMEDYLIGM